MAFEWLKNFQGEMEKPANYAEKTLAAYKLGMKAGGSIAGVRIQTDPRCCEVAKTLDTAHIYHPDEAPRLPLPHCTNGNHCLCVYRPVMTYEVAGEKMGNDE